MAENTRTVLPPVKKNKRWWRFLIEILLIVLVVLAARAWQQRGLVSGEAPSFQSVLLNGEVVNLEDYQGKPFILHFWADWCHFCKLEEGSLSSIQKDWPVLSVAYQSGDSKNVANYMQQRGIQHWPTIVDEEQYLGDLFGVKGVPTSYIIDGNGNIRFREVGLTSGWGLRARLWWAKTFNKPATE